MKNGVPFDRVFEVGVLMEHERMAMSIKFSEFEGHEFDWEAMRFRKKEENGV